MSPLLVVAAAVCVWLLPVVLLFLPDPPKGRSDD